MIIFTYTDPHGDSINVDTFSSDRFGSGIAVGSDSGHPVWLTPEQSKRLRKALKRWEKSVTK